ncbi:MAG: ferritin [Candidatus Marsarchaeota archaeon]|nr:ferritin [Candidatus Marsarchaeota archaeon]MCL5105897.1 ferritin [Candidatus Marsarchaeota archaeon]
MTGDSISKNKKTNVEDINRARQSLVEELQAQKWYDERISATSDKSLKEMLSHNRDDEKEHASLLIEWLRRNDAPFDKELNEILFKNKGLSELWD